MFFNFEEIKPIKEFKEIIPEARYPMALTSFVSKENPQNPKTSGLYEIEFIIQSGEFKGEIVTHGIFTHSDDPKQLERAGRQIQAIYEACTGSLLKARITSPADFENYIIKPLIGKLIVVSVKQWKNKDGYWNNNCSGFYPAASYDKDDVKSIPKHNPKYLEYLQNPQPETSSAGGFIPQEPTGGFVQQSISSVPPGFN